MKVSAVSKYFVKYLNHTMVQLERRRGLLFSVIILGAIVSGSVYYYVRDYWNIEAKVKLRLIFSAYSVNVHVPVYLVPRQFLLSQVIFCHKS